MPQQPKIGVRKSELRALTIPTQKAVVLIEVSDEESQLKFMLQIKLHLTDFGAHFW